MADRGTLVIASNRLPITLTVNDGALQVEPSSGGLVSALRGGGRPYSWVGWPGLALPPELLDEGTKRIEEAGCEPVFLSEEEQEAFYGRISNDTIWPLFHYFVDRMRFTSEAWATYAEINERFAEAIARVAAPRAQVWIHDFQLALVPEALRRLRPDVAIGFFLHIPFPSSEVYRLLPTRVEFLRGMLGADYIGFHNGDYTRHFRSACLRVLGIEAGPDAIEYDDRTVGIGVHPIGIDVESFVRAIDEPETEAIERRLDEQFAGGKLVLGVERLDYTKGIPQKLAAFERILEQDPELAETVTLLQVLVPSRLENSEYLEMRDEIERMIAHINGRFGSLGRTPIEYVHRSVSLSELIALYRRADVMMVTPLRDGMNLVAQEFVLCQSARPEQEGSWHGALLLSEFAGAAHVLPGAVLVNPWDADDLAGKLLEALTLSAEERRRRLELMAHRVEALDSQTWMDGFLKRLERFARPARRVARPLDEAARERIAGKLALARTRAFLLDYDGTLRELVGHPDLAAPTSEIRELLRELAALPGAAVHIVSGRTQKSLEDWFGDLPVHLSAEHGYFVRPIGGEWQVDVEVDLGWLPAVEALFDAVAADVPGTLVERKAASVAWHYRQAEPEYGAWRARELLSALESLLGGVAAEVLPGHRVIEVRARGVNKGTYLEHLLPHFDLFSTAILAAGDDLTDADLFRVLPRGSVAIHVGSTKAQVDNPALRDRYVVDSPSSLRAVLRGFIVDLTVLTRAGAAWGA